MDNAGGLCGCWPGSAFAPLALLSGGMAAAVVCRRRDYRRGLGAWHRNSGFLAFESVSRRGWRARATDGDEPEWALRSTAALTHIRDFAVRPGHNADFVG